MSTNPQYSAVASQSLWPTTVYTLDLKDTESLAQYREQILTLETQEGRQGANGIWTSPDDLDLRPEYQGLRDCILASVELTVQDRSIDYLGLRMNCMWANINRSYGTHQQHTHPNSMWSAVLYLNVDDKDPGLLYFKDPRPQANNIVYDYVQGSEQSDHWSIEPKLGRMVVFPSWLEHGTHASSSPEPRICVSANIMLECTMRRHNTIRAEFR